MNKDVKQLQEAYNKIAENIFTDVLDLEDTEQMHDTSHETTCDVDAISMAKTQFLNIMHNVQEILDVIEDVESFEPWMTGLLSDADSTISRLKEFILFRE